MNEPVLYGYTVRFKGHLCGTVRTGLSKKPLLMRAKTSEEQFVVLIEANNLAPKVNQRLARLECARAIKRTEYARRTIRNAGRDHMLRGIPSVERILKDAPDKRRAGSGKRWKICPVYL